MTDKKKYKIWWLVIILAVVLLPFTLIAGGKKKADPYDVFDHEMHTPLFESVSLSCETCHKDPESYSNRKKINPEGCHTCHNSPKPPLEATRECTLCHTGGPPKPQNHKVDWNNKHQVYAKADPKSCLTCHKNEMFCIDCHQRRDTVQEKVHRRNFKLTHSIVARTNPRKCSTCHTVSYCQQCHAGGGTSKR